jgi:hypothetical protein
MTSTETYMTESELKLADGTVIGTTNMHPEFFRTNGGRNGGWRLGAMPHDTYELGDSFQDTHEDTTVYIGDEVS